jgi:crossover junction endodeoxyribonuclease RuvC
VDDLLHTYVGIDPGLEGGIAVYRTSVTTPPSWYVLPLPTIDVGGKKELDIKQLAIFIDTLTNVALVTVEYPPKVPGNGVLSIASLFKGFGQIIGMLATLDLPMLRPNPQQWKKVVLAGTNKDKNAAIDYVRFRFPEIDLPKKGPKSKKYHDGIADAICLCWYGVTNGRPEKTV